MASRNDCRGREGVYLLVVEEDVRAKGRENPLLREALPRVATAQVALDWWTYSRKVASETQRSLNSLPFLTSTNLSLTLLVVLAGKLTVCST